MGLSGGFWRLASTALALEACHLASELHPNPVTFEGSLLAY